MGVLKPPGPRKAGLAKVMTWEQEVQVATCHPRENCIQWFWRCSDLPCCPTLGTVNLMPARVLGLPQSIEID